SWSGLGRLEPGQSVTLDTTFTVIAKPASGSTGNVATAAGLTDANGDPVPTASSTATLRVVSPSVRVDKSLASGQDRSVLIGETVTYDIVVTNTGDTTLTVVPLRDAYPSQLAFSASTPVPDRTSAGVLEWDDITRTLGDIAPGQSRTVRTSFVATATAAAVTNSVTVAGAADEAGRPTSSTTDADTDLTILGPATAVLLKSATPAPETVMMPGDTITYTLSFENTTSVAIPAVVVRDALPETVSYVKGSLSYTIDGLKASLTDKADADAGSVTGGAVAVNVGTLAPGSKGSVTFSVKVKPADISRPGVFNSFTLQSGDATPQVSNTVRHPVDPFDIVKTARDVNGGKLEPGDVIEWTIVVTNTGLVPTTHVRVVDPLPAGITYVRGSITGKGADDSDPRELVW
ncbi:MAG: DUF11 domain-containing protein, partial [Actinobacteria bacterium]